MLVVLLFLLGLCVGSFINVVIDRLPEGKSVLWGRSYCDRCQRRLAWCDLLPLLSFALLRGRCRCCGEKISWQYPIVELTTGLIFALSTITNQQSTIVYLLSSVFLVPIFVIDLKHGIISDKIVFPAILVALSAQLLAPSFRILNLYKDLRNDVGGLGQYLLQTDYFRNHVWLEVRPLLWTLLGSFVLCFLFFVLHHLFHGRALGGGDVKLALLVGLITGFPNMIVAVFSSFLTGALASVILMLLGKKKFGETVPFGPFLVLGTYIALFFGESIIKWYLKFL